VGVIGFGRFGTTFASTFKEAYVLERYSRNVLSKSSRVKVNQSQYKPEVLRGFQEVKVTK